MSIKILVSDPLSEEGLKILKNENDFKIDVKTKLTPPELLNQIKDYDVLLVRSSTKVTKEVIEAGTKLRIIGRAGVGLDNVDLDAASKKGIIVMNTPGGNTMSTAEHAFSLIMSLMRNIPQANASMKRGEWDRKKFMGAELYGKTLGIVGLGRIGTEVATRANSFKMKVLAYDPFLSIEKAKELGVEVVDLQELFKNSDIITVHTPLTDQTKHLIGEEAFKIMKYGVRLINCARGGIIDEAALNKYAESGKVAGAALDVYENEPPKGSPLIARENVIMTPHLGASTEEAQVNVAIDIAESVRDALLNKGIRNAVNMPSVDPEVLKYMEPYLNLAEKIGSFQAQITDGHIKNVKVRYIGEITSKDTSPLTIALMKGLLTPILQENVNYVNARVIAKERGINIIESKSSDIEDFANLITVEVETNKSKNVVVGTLFTKVDPRIVKVNEFYVDAVPSGCMLIISNTDVPGVVGSIGMILGESKINIAGMTFGRVKERGKALTILNIDCPATNDILEKLKKSPNIDDVRFIKL